MNYQEYQSKKQNIEDIRAAKSRCWASWVWCLAGGAIGSVVRSAQTGNWRPTLVATGAAVVCLPIASVDMGFTLATVPPVTAAALFTSSAMSARKKLGIVLVTEADELSWNNGLT